MNSISQDSPCPHESSSPSPISLIPFENLAIVFQFVFQTDEFSCHTRLDLAIVCRKWRDTIYSHPRFWTNNCCSTYSTAFAKRSTELVPQLQRWLERAGALPLTLKLTMTPTLPTPEELPALTSFLIRTTRWHNLHLKLVADPETGYTHTWIWLDSLFSAVGAVLKEEGSSPWETLQKLEIEARDVRLQEFTRLPFARLAPNLRELNISLRQIPNAYRLVEGFVNPKELRRLEIDALISWKDDILPTFYYHTLAQAANLETLKLSDYDCRPALFLFNFSETVPSFPVPNLTLTTLAIHDNRATRNCLQNLSLPSLTSLTLISSKAEFTHDSSPSLAVTVKRLIALSDCKIKHVRLEDLDTARIDGDWYSFLRLLTTVESLELLVLPTLHNPCYLQLLLRIMSHETLDANPILPNLISVSVHRGGLMTRETKEAFTNFVEHPARWSGSEEGSTANPPGDRQCARLENAHLFSYDDTSTSIEYARGRRDS